MYKLSTAILAFTILVITTIMSNAIEGLRTQVHDRDVALDIVAHAVNTQQGMLDNRARHIQQLESALGQCMAVCGAAPAK